MCFNFIHEWRNLQFDNDPEQQICEIFHGLSDKQEIAQKIVFHISLCSIYLIWELRQELSIKLYIYYMIGYGNFKMLDYNFE